MADRALITMVAWVLAAAGAQAQNVESLSPYRPEQQVSGTIRQFGSPLSGMVQAWEEGFRKLQPAVSFEDKFPSSDGAVGGLIAGVSDIGTSGREPMLTEYLSFQETFGYDLVEVPVATGAFDIKGKTWALVVFVNKDNPITKLTMKQLDGIFGSERTGGYRGYKWYPQLGRSAKDDIRTWGQLGLTGEWADKPIHTYGYAFTGMTNFFEREVFAGGQKWNPNYRQYVESDTKMVSDGDVGKAGGSYHMLSELSSDKYGIAWTGIPHARNYPDVRPVALAAKEGGPYFEPSRETVLHRQYPLTRSIFMYIKKAPGQPVEPKVKEFLRYILSREGQADVARVNVYLPLTPEVVREQLANLER
jgi:phosphate transport system substrate-binding protein